MNIIYLTNDANSHHTLKRKIELEKNNFSVKIIGFINSDNDDSKVINQNENFLKIKSGYFFYLVRIFNAFIIAMNIKLNYKNHKIIVRGFEFIIPLKLMSLDFSFEITDIPNLFFKNKIYTIFLKQILNKNKIFFTSPEFNKIFGFNNFLIFHNKHNLKGALPNKLKKNKILYAGYIRDFTFLIKKFKAKIPINFYGLLNIRGIDYSDKYLNNFYKGKYKSSDCHKIYSNYRYSYISDFHGENSRYNLTNRLYESIFNYSIPVEISTNFQKRYINNLNLFFVKSIDDINFFNSLEIDQQKKILRDNFNILKNVVEKDHNRIFKYLKNE